MSCVVRTAGDLGRSHAMSVRRRPQDPSVPIDYVLLAGDAGPGAAEAEHDAGYAAGYAAGQDAARAEAVSEAGLAHARLEQALGALGQASRAAVLACAERRDQLEHSVTAFAFELVETLVGRELALSTHPGRDAVARALAVDRSDAPATVRIHPDDAGALSDLDADALTGTRELHIVVDASVEPGGALVEIGEATIDSQISAAVQRVRDMLLGQRDPARTEHDEGAP
jgi:flagellar assembly protein FliH